MPSESLKWATPENNSLNVGSVLYFCHFLLSQRNNEADKCIACSSISNKVTILKPQAVLRHLSLAQTLLTFLCLLHNRNYTRR